MEKNRLIVLRTFEKASQERWNLSWMLKSLESECQEKEEKRVDQVEGYRYETRGTPGRMVGSSFSWSKDFGRPMEGIWGNNARLQMA